MKAPIGFLITGASQGIGLECALALADAFPGAAFWLVGRDASSLHLAGAKIVARGAGQTYVEAMDLESLTDRQAQSLRERIANGCDHLAGVIHNAGAFTFSEVLGGEHGAIARQLVQLNLVAPMVLDAALLPLMAEASRPGVVLFVNSTAGMEHRPGNEAYSASKAGLLAYANALRESLRPRGLAVVSVCPGPVFTRSWKGFEHASDRMLTARVVGKEIARQVQAALSGEFVCEQVQLRHVSGAI